MDTRKVAVIGLGTGLTTVRALVDHPEFIVTGFDARNRLGGHIHSINVRYLRTGQAVVVKDINDRPPANQQWRDSRIITLEGGAEFIGPPELYTNFHKLCKEMSVDLKKFELNMRFNDYGSGTNNQNRTITLPPIFTASKGFNDSDAKGELDPKFMDRTQYSAPFESLLNRFEKNTAGKAKFNTRVDIKTIFKDADELIRLFKAINKAHQELSPDSEFKTLEQFINEFINDCQINCLQKSREKFANDVLYPFIAAGWGVSVDTIKAYGAYYAMLYLAAGKDWYDAPSGLSTYIKKLENEIKEKTSNVPNHSSACSSSSNNSSTTQAADILRLNTKIKRLVPIVDNQKIKYKLLLSDGTYAKDTANKETIYDHLVLTSPADITKDLLADFTNEKLEHLLNNASSGAQCIPQNERQAVTDDFQKIIQLKNTLAGVKYYKTTIAFHQDPTYESERDTVVHTRIQDGVSANTMCKRWKFPVRALPVMKSWVLPGQPKPKNIVKEVHYSHPVMDRNYHAAQKALNNLQGTLGLQFGGIISGHNDSHESGVKKALENAYDLIKSICKKIKKESFLRPFLDSISKKAKKKIRLGGHCSFFQSFTATNEQNINISNAQASSTSASSSSDNQNQLR